MEKKPRLIRINEVVGKTAIPKSTIYWMIANGKFPKQIKISERISVWNEQEINNWIDEKISENQEVA